MKEGKYSLDQIKLLESQMAIRRVLKKGDLVYVSDEDFAVIQSILNKNKVLYSSIRDPESEINTLLIVELSNEGMS